MNLTTDQVYDLICRSWDRPGVSELMHDWPHKIYGRSDASIWAIVDEEDVEWARQWLWSYAMSPRGKIYVMRRTGGTRIMSGGEVIARKKYTSIYLHREIIKRAGKVPLDEEHCIVDHGDTNSLNCRRGNLEYVTIGENNRRTCRIDKFNFIEDIR